MRIHLTASNSDNQVSSGRIDTVATASVRSFFQRNETQAWLTEQLERGQQITIWLETNEATLSHG